MSEREYTYEDIWFMLKQFVMDDNKEIFKKMFDLEKKYIWNIEK